MVLDLQCWLDEGGFLRWQHYRKPMANPRISHAVSAKVRRARDLRPMPFCGKW